MKITGRLPATAGSIVIFCQILAGCAAPAPPALIASQSQPMSAKFDPATVTAVRHVDLAKDAGSLAGVQYVLNALQQAPPAGPVAADEIVLMKADGTAASVVEPGIAPSPGFVAGDRVAILEGTPTTLIHRN